MIDATVKKEAFEYLIDLAAERLGGRAVAANDEFFAPKENLVRPTRGLFDPDRYTERGKWMDGWETRRRRTPGHDWCIVRLGLPGVIYGVDIDTNHFLGNHPPHASLDACALPADASLDEATWPEILPKVDLAPGSQNRFSIESRDRWTHIRLKIYPDGGVARLRVYGHAAPDALASAPEAVIDLAAMEHGGVALACSDRFFSDAQNLLLPGPSLNMGDGWETRRRRGPGHDWAVVRLGAAAQLRHVVVDTQHYKGNFPARASLDAAFAPEAPVLGFEPERLSWTEILAPQAMQADHAHRFDELAAAGPFTHLRLNIYPDGGVARLRVFGVREP